MASFVRALLEREHHVTFLTGTSMQKLELVNYTEILVDPPFDFAKECSFLPHKARNILNSKMK